MKTKFLRENKSFVENQDFLMKGKVLNEKNIFESKQYFFK